MKQIYSLFILCFLFLCSCGIEKKKSYPEELYVTNNTDPQYILNELNSLDQSGMNKKDRLHYFLQTIAIKEQLGYSLVSDSLKLTHAVIYYNDNNNKNNLFKALFFLGVTFEQSYKYQYALICYKEALVIADLLNDKKSIAFLHGKIGLMYIYEYDKTEGLIHLYQALESLKLIDKTDFGISFQIQAGKTYLYNSLPQEALPYFQSAVENMKKNDIRYSSLLRHIGITYVDLMDWEKAVDCLKESLKFEAVKENIAMNNLILMYIYMQTGEDNLANNYRHETETLLLDVSNKELLQEFYKLSSESYVHKGDLKNALRSLHQSLIYKDGIHEYLNNGTVDELILLYQKEKLITENNTLKTRFKVYTLFILFLCFVIFVIYRLIRKKKEARLYEYEIRIETLEKMLKENKSNSIELKNILIRDLEITKRIALFKSRHSERNQTLVDKVQNLFIIDDKHPFEIEWKKFYSDVDKLCEDYFTKLQQKYPLLSEKELQLCCLMRIGFKTDEIAAIWNQSVFSVQKSRSSIRKKIGTGEGADIISFIEKSLNQ